MSFCEASPSGPGDAGGEDEDLLLRLTATASECVQLRATVAEAEAEKARLRAELASVRSTRAFEREPDAALELFQRIAELEAEKELLVDFVSGEAKNLDAGGGAGEAAAAQEEEEAAEQGARLAAEAAAAAAVAAAAGGAAAAALALEERAARAESSASSSVAAAAAAARALEGRVRDAERRADEAEAEARRERAQARAAADGAARSAADYEAAMALIDDQDALIGRLAARLDQALAQRARAAPPLKHARDPWASGPANVDIHLSLRGAAPGGPRWLRRLDTTGRPG